MPSGPLLPQYFDTTLPYRIAVSLGRVPGWSDFRKFAMNNDVDAGIEEIWPLGTLKTLPAAAGVATATSDSATGEDEPGGTGCLTLVIQGLDADYNLIEETVTMNGSTGVSTTQEFFRIYRAYVDDCGSGEVNDGNITITIGGNAQAYIEADEGQTHISSYTVPADYTLIIDNVKFSTGRIGNFDSACQLQTIDRRTAGKGWRTLVDVQAYQTDWWDNSSVLVVPEKHDIRGLIETTATNSECSLVYAGFLIDNEYL